MYWHVSGHHPATDVHSSCCQRFKFSNKLHPSSLNETGSYVCMITAIFIKTKQQYMHYRLAIAISQEINDPQYTVSRCLCLCRGSAAANSISQISICLLLFAYIRWKKLHVDTWGGEEYMESCTHRDTHVCFYVIMGSLTYTIFTLSQL